MKQPKVLVFCPWAHSNSYYTAKFCNALGSRDIPVFLVIPRNFMTHLLSPNVNQIQWPYVAPDHIDLKNLIQSPSQAMRLKRIIRQIQPEWVHLIWTHHVPILLIPLLKKFFIAYTVHDPILHSGESGLLRSFIHRQHINMSTVFFVHGEENKKTLIQNYRVAHEKIYVIPHGEFTFWEDIPKTQQENSILFFGRIRRYKGLEVLLRAFEKISPYIPDYRLSIYGNGDLGELNRRMQSMRNVTVVNRFIHHEEIPRLFLRSKFVVLPYTDATQSGVVPMAFALGRTCIASAVGSIPEVVSHGENGLLVPPNDANALANTMLQLAQDEPLRCRLEEGALASCRHSDALSWDRAGRIATDVYKASIKR